MLGWLSRRRCFTSVSFTSRTFLTATWSEPNRPKNTAPCDPLPSHVRSEMFSNGISQSSSGNQHMPEIPKSTCMNRILAPNTGSIYTDTDIYMYHAKNSGGFRWGQACSSPPHPFGRLTDAVTHGTPEMWQRYYVTPTPSPFLSLQARKTWYSEYSKWLPPVALRQI